jgi:hypothetical protein
MGDRVRRSLAGGFTYLLVLIAIATISAVAALSLQQGRALAQRDKELELLYLGGQFRQALLSFAASTPAGAQARPRSLEQLVRDDRGPVVRRHLRRVFVDPLTGSTTWGVVRDSNGDVTGVYSLASGTPVKQENFEAPFEFFRDSRTYADWIFSTMPLRRRN